MKQKVIAILALFLAVFAGSSRAQRYSPVALPSMFSDHMVLQQRSSVALWGWADAGNTVRVVPGWATGDTLSARVDCIGCWRVAVPTAKAGGPYTLEVFCGRDRIVLRDVMLGEVWLCSGQSNMEWTPDNGLTDAKREIAAADCPAVRFFQAPKRGSRTLQDDCGGQWETCTPDVMRRHSAVAYFFARHLSDSLGVPVGILESAWGGTPAEVWMPENWENANILHFIDKKKPWIYYNGDKFTSEYLNYLRLTPFKGFLLKYYTLIVPISLLKKFAQIMFSVTNERGTNKKIIRILGLKFSIDRTKQVSA